MLKDEHDRLAQKRDELTQQEKQTLENQAITLDGLESGRRQAKAKGELEKQQRENEERRAKIERENAAKKAKDAGNSKKGELPTNCCQAADMQ